MGLDKKAFNSSELQKGMEGDNGELNKHKVEEILKLMLLDHVNDQFDSFFRVLLFCIFIYQ